MDPIPLPQQTPPASVQKPQDVGMGMDKPPDPQTYYGGKAGVVAHYADKLLTGWMAGKKIKEDSLRNKAAEAIGGSKSAVDTIGQSYRAAVESGDQEKIASTKKALTAAWTNYIGQAEKYVAPPDDQKKGVGKKIKDAIVPHGPQIYQQASLDLLKKTDPTTLYGPSKEDQLRQQNEQAKLEDAGRKQEFDKLDLEDRKKLDASRDEYLKALGSGDTNKADDAARKYEANGGKVNGLPSRQKLDEQYTQTALAGVQAVNAGKPFGELSEMQQAAMVHEGLGPQIKTGLQAYLTQVGPGKRFANEYEAAEKYNRDVTTNRIMGERPTPLEELRASSKVILAHDMQDPAKAKKMGLSAPLKAGEQPPAWLVEQEADKRYKHSPEDTEEAKLYADKAVSNIVGKSMGTMSPTEQATAKQYFLSTDPDTHMQALNPFPDLSKVPEGQKQQVIAVGKALRQRAEKWTKTLYPDADDATIQERLGPVPPEFQQQGMTAPPKAPQKSFIGRMEEKVGNFFAPPPDEKANDKQPFPGMAAPPGSYKPEAHYKLSTKDGKSLYSGEAVELTADDAKKLAAAGYALEEVQ